MSDDTKPDVDDAQVDDVDDGAPADDGADKSTKDDVFDAERAKRELNKKNNEAANLRKRLKELEPLAAKAKELEDASKTESERLSERATSAEAKASKAEAEAMRLRVALSKGLTLSQVKRLQGTTEEELEADADEYLEELGAKKEDPPPRVPGKPRESLRGGGKPDDEPEETDPRKLAAAIRRD